MGVEAVRSAFAGKWCTHVRARDDAIILGGPFVREYVPDGPGDIVWVDSLDQLRAVGGNVGFNEDQTEIHLTLPVGHKFSIAMFRKEKEEE
jgi:hypothetical protein